MSLKVLACGDVGGNFGALFKRLENVEKKAGPFEMVLCVGSFFGGGGQQQQDHKDKPDKDSLLWADYLSGKKRVPIPVYLLGPNRMGECHNFTEMGG